MKRVNPLVRRAVLTEQTRARFYGRPFKWGSSDCAKMAAFHAKKFGWKVPVPGGYSTALGAAKRLRELGYDTLPDLVAGYGLKEIAPAFAMTGDIVSSFSDDALGSIGIVLGNGRMLAFHEVAVGAAVITMDSIERAWSIWPGDAT